MSRLNFLRLCAPDVDPWTVLGRSNANIETSGTDFCFVNEREPDEGRWATELDDLSVRGGDITGKRRTGFPLTRVVVVLS